MIFKVVISILISFYGLGTVTDNDVIFKDIKKEYRKIQKEKKSYKLIEVEIPERQSADGAGAIGYYKESEIKMIEEYWYFESGKEINEYYFSCNELIFVISIDYIYNLPYYEEKHNPNKTKTEEDRYYFNNGKLISYKSNYNNTKKLTPSELLQIEAEIIAAMNEVRDYLKNP